MYGYDWGNSEETITNDSDGAELGNYRKIKDEYLLPNIKASTTILEIGYLGGKWTQYFLEAGKIICADLSEESFNYIKKKIPSDIIFSMDTFVRVEKYNLSMYFKHFSRILRNTGKMCIHLPCTSSPLSVKKEFVDLHPDEIAEKMISNGFSEFTLDFSTINHGVILTVWFIVDEFV